MHEENVNQNPPRFVPSIGSKLTPSLFLVGEASICSSLCGLITVKPIGSPSLRIFMESSSFTPFLVVSEPSWSPNFWIRTCDLKISKTQLNNNNRTPKHVFRLDNQAKLECFNTKIGCRKNTRNNVNIYLPFQFVLKLWITIMCLHKLL